MTRSRLCRLADLPELEVRVFELDDVRVAVARSGERIFAVEDRCSHDDGELGAGRVLTSEGAAPQVECPRHGGRFDVSTGLATRMPAVAPIEVFPAGVEDDGVWIDLPEW